LQPFWEEQDLVTLREVAERAGVSIKTVSRIVNGDPAVNAKTRDFVKVHLQSLNYIPNQAARLMRGGQSSVYGLMTDAVATTPYSVDIVRGAQAALKEQNQTLLIANSNGDATQEAEFWRMFRAQRVSGVIYASVFHRAHDMGHPAYHDSIVLANCYAGAADRPSLIPDDEAGGYTQAEYLLKRGHRRIGLLTLIPQIDATRLRGLGIRRAFKDASVAFDENLDQQGMVGQVHSEKMVAFEAAVKMLQQKNRPTAIICGNDAVALQVYSAAAHLDLHVPQDLSIMGFDDLKVISENLRPSLTSVALLYFEIGRRAVELMRESKNQDEGWAPKILVPCPLVERESCRTLN
jgi:LacI family transcriptional regulator